MARLKTSYTWAALALAGALALGGCGGGGDEVGSVGDAPTATTKAKAMPGIGAKVRDGKFEFVVKKMTCGVAKVGAGFAVKKAQGDYCVLDLQVANIGDEPQMFADASLKGFIGKTEYGADSTATLYSAGDSDVWLADINPGNKITVKVAFDVPAGKKLTTVELHDSMFSGGETVQVS